MDWISTLGLIDPDHDQPPPGFRTPDHLVSTSFSQVGIDAARVSERVVNLFNRDAALRMILAKVLSVRGISDNRPIVRPFSIYVVDGQKGSLLGRL